MESKIKVFAIAMEDEVSVRRNNPSGGFIVDFIVTRFGWREGRMGNEMGNMAEYGE